MISLLCPSRSRPEQALTLLKSFQNTQDNQNEIIFCLQNGDPKIEEYISIFNKINFTDYLILDPMPTSYLWNQLSFIAKGDLFTLIGDDVEIITKSWDTIIENAAKVHQDKIFVITVNDGRKDRPQGQNMRCPHPTVHREWAKTLGYFVPPFYMHRYLDAYTQKLALELKRFIELPQITFEHKKFNFISDDTGQRSRRWLNYDKFVHENISPRYFQKDLDLLRSKLK